MNEIPSKVQKDFKAWLDTMPYKIKKYKIMFVGPIKPDGATRENMIYESEYPILLTFRFYDEEILVWCLVGIQV